MAVSFDPGQETNDFETSNSVFSSVELEIRAIVSFKVISWYEVTLLLGVESIARLQLSLFLCCYCAVDALSTRRF